MRATSPVPALRSASEPPRRASRQRAPKAPPGRRVVQGNGASGGRERRHGPAAERRLSGCARAAPSTRDVQPRTRRHYAPLDTAREFHGCPRRASICRTTTRSDSSPRSGSSVSHLALAVTGIPVRLVAHQRPAATRDGRALSHRADRDPPPGSAAHDAEIGLCRQPATARFWAGC